MGPSPLVIANVMLLRWRCFFGNKGGFESVLRRAQGKGEEEIVLFRVIAIQKTALPQG